MINIKDIINVSQTCMQKDFAVLIGVSGKTVSELQDRKVINPGEPVGKWLLSYCAHIREQAAGRATNGELNLADERAKLAQQQTFRIELQNAVTRREYGPIDALEQGLADAMAKAASQLDTIPGKLKMASDKLSAADLNLISGVIAEVRNNIADLDIDWFSDKSEEKNDDNNDSALEE